ncbi:hypothetical protein QVD17_37923 [Tagetes erecta]|uniref:Uncharacterized protein n=1 Tax=Tagetes erecta TaxID=13708 RepID=A0AAD8ND48_TARER|nr:hypothetical protein QVD17_37923 [Tagetes erecta]
MKLHEHKDLISLTSATNEAFDQLRANSLSFGLLIIVRDEFLEVWLLSKVSLNDAGLEVRLRLKGGGHVGEDCECDGLWCVGCGGF